MLVHQIARNLVEMSKDLGTFGTCLIYRKENRLSTIGSSALNECFRDGRHLFKHLCAIEQTSKDQDVTSSQTGSETFLKSFECNVLDRFYIGEVENEFSMY